LIITILHNIILQISIDHIKPKPLLFSKAISNISFNLSLLLYSGISRWLKQVWAMGSLSSSSPCLPILIRRCPSPNIGALSLPVQNAKSLFYYFSVSSWTIFQNHFTTGLCSVKPSKYLADLSHYVKSSFFDPTTTTKSSSSSGLNTEVITSSLHTL